MADHFYGKTGGEAKLITRQEQLPDNARLLTDEEVMTIQIERMKRLKPTWEKLFYEYSGYIGLSTTVVSGLFIEMAVRKNCRLGGLSNVLTKLAATIVPALSSIVFHDIYIKNKIMTGREQHCVMCSVSKSGALQCSQGVLYTYCLSMLSCVQIAQKYWTLPQPKNESFPKLVHKLSPSVRTMLPLLGINFVVGGAIAVFDHKLFIKYLAKPPSSEDMEFLAEKAAEQ